MYGEECDELKRELLINELHSIDVYEVITSIIAR